MLQYTGYYKLRNSETVYGVWGLLELTAGYFCHAALATLDPYVQCKCK